METGSLLLKSSKKNTEKNHLQSTNTKRGPPINFTEPRVTLPIPHAPEHAPTPTHPHAHKHTKKKDRETTEAAKHESVLILCICDIVPDPTLLDENPHLFVPTERSYKLRTPSHPAHCAFFNLRALISHSLSH